MTAGPEVSRKEETPRGAWPWLLAIAVLLLGLCAVAVPRSIGAGDAGEFATVMLRGGVPHPSGYPWMRMLGVPARGLHALGLAPASAAAWPCAVAGVGAWLLLWPRLARWSSRPVATAVVLVLATTSPMAVHVVDSEVWGPHLLACAAVLWVTTGDTPRPATIGLVFGLAVSNHLSAALLLPLVVGAAWPRPLTASALARRAAIGVGAGLVGLVPYATLALGDGDAWRWGDTGSLSGLVAHVLRADYGVLSLSLHEETPEVLDQWSRALSTVGAAVTGGLGRGSWPSLVALLAIAAGARRPPAGVRPPVWWGLWGTLIATTLAFPAAHNIDPTRVFGAWILERFDLLTILLWSIPSAVALQRLVDRAASRPAKLALAVAVVTLLATQLLRTHARGVPSQDEGVERYARDLLQTPPDDRLSIVIGTDDHRTFPVLYCQQVLGLGPRVVYIDASLLSQPWYRAHLRRQWPDLPEIEKPVAMIGALWRDPAHADTPIYLANVFSRPSTTLPMVPEGILLRVLPPHALDTPPETIVARHIAAMKRYGPPPATVRRAAHPWTEDLLAAYNEGTARLLAALAAEGRDAEARAMLQALPPSPP